jgi:hypothetical protein
MLGDMVAPRVTLKGRRSTCFEQATVHRVKRYCGVVESNGFVLDHEPVIQLEVERDRDVLVLSSRRVIAESPGTESRSREDRTLDIAEDMASGDIHPGTGHVYEEAGEHKGLLFVRSRGYLNAGERGEVPAGRSIEALVKVGHLQIVQPNVVYTADVRRMQAGCGVCRTP